MEFVLIFVLSLLVAMITNHVGPRFYASTYGSKYRDSYAGKTVTTALVIFVAIVAASFIMSAAYKKPTLPSA
jgi:hypothetical protein